MSRAAIIHLFILGILVCVTLIVWKMAEDHRAEALAAPVEDEFNVLGDAKREVMEEASVMGKVAIPMVLTGLYAAFVTIAFLLPAAADRFSQEAMGSAEDIEDDPLRDAHSAVARGEFEEAITAYHLAAQAHPEDRTPVVEIAKIEQNHLEKPDQAAMTLKTALESRSWTDEDAVFMMFRLAELYRDELSQPDEAKALYGQIETRVPGTRHSANAAHELRQLQAS